MKLEPPNGPNRQAWQNFQVHLTFSDMCFKQTYLVKITYLSYNFMKMNFMGDIFCCSMFCLWFRCRCISMYVFVKRMNAYKLNSFTRASSELILLCQRGKKTSLLKWCR